ncbi:PEP-CTERM sorting domain-containing protein [Microcystis sp. M049S2]|uniref:PEP-CTERM sorting domain-containing protein n=1 Tax=Microcystis sp. M049S2 TaxID=2771169 RepID=UPI00258B8679|nr:PEP-CTERM sorting domain-containing protein [Microcystis sp. M049S2]
MSKKSFLLATMFTLSGLSLPAKAVNLLIIKPAPKQIPAEPGDLVSASVAIEKIDPEYPVRRIEFALGIDELAIREGEDEKILSFDQTYDSNLTAGKELRTYTFKVLIPVKDGIPDVFFKSAFVTFFNTEYNDGNNPLPQTFRRKCTTDSLPEIPFCRRFNGFSVVPRDTPEPSAILSFLALGTLGAASTLKRKLKP